MQLHGVPGTSNSRAQRAGSQRRAIAHVRQQHVVRQSAALLGRRGIQSAGPARLSDGLVAHVAKASEAAAQPAAAPATPPAATGLDTARKAAPEDRLCIALVGFGVFGQFLAKRMVMRGHRVIAWNKTPYPDTAKELGVEFYHDLNDLCEEHPQVVILVTSILSTSIVLDSLPLMRLKRSTLIVDVLSVKVFPKQLLLQKLPPELDILCTHPMFGPNSGSGSWKGLNFQYEKVRVYNNEPAREARANRFLKFFAEEGCNMVEMTCEEHDQAAASTQFVTHTVGRTLGTLRLQPTPIDTKGFEALLQLVNQTNTDSFDLYYGLFLYNQNATDELERLEKGLESVKDRLFSQLHDVARRKVFPKSMLEKMLSKAGTKVLKAFFRGIARQGKISLASSDDIALSLSSKSIDSDYDVPRFRDHPQEVLPVYRHMLTLWREKAQGKTRLVEDDPTALPHTVPPALTVLREAFAYMDLDASGSLTVGELAARMLKLTNTRVSTTDIENVLKAADTSFNGQVFFKDMVVFAAYEFFCSGATHTGCMDILSLTAAAQYLEFSPKHSDEATMQQLLAYARSQLPEFNERDPTAGLQAFSLVFRDERMLKFLESK